MREDLMLQPGRRRPRRPWRWLEILILFTFALCLALGATAIYLLWRSTTAPQLASPINPPLTLATDQIVPQLALRHLAGDPSGALAQQASQAGHLATADALLLFDTHSAATTRTALWLQLAQRYLAQAEHANAQRAARIVEIHAVTELQLAPIERAQLLSQVAAIFAQTAATSQAINAAQQAISVAAQTPDWLPAQRSQIFSGLQPLAAQLNDPALQQRLAEYLQNPFLTPSGVVVSSTLFALAEPLTLTAELSAAVTLRQQAGLILADRLLSVGASDVEPERQALIAALVNEDTLGRARHDQLQAGGSLSLPQQFGLLLEQRDWLAIKLQVALGGYGLALVPEWERNPAAIRSEISQNVVNLAVVMNALADAQPNPAQQSAVRLDAILWQIRQAELGLYPNPPVADLQERLRSTQIAFEQTVAPIALPVGYVEQRAADQVTSGFYLQQK